MSQEPNFFDTVGTARRISGPHKNVGDLVSENPQPVDPNHRRDSGTSRWSSHEGKYWGASLTSDHLPPGLYRCGQSPTIGYYLDKMVNDTDTLMRLPDSQVDEVLREITEFSILKPAFVQRGFLYKRGILLWGPPGSGKTCCLRLLIQMVIESMGGIAIFVDHPNIASGCLQLARKIEPQRQIIAILEDLDALVERYGENEYLALLDGESQVDNLIAVATTNYPERLDRRFVDRPSRFDTIRYVGMPSAAARRTYLSTKEPSLSPDALEMYVAESDGFSIAHLRELVILTQCFGRPLESAIVRLKKMQVAPQSGHRPDAPAFGFGG